MARVVARKKKPQPSVVPNIGPIPESVAKSRPMLRQRISARSLPKFNLDMLAAWSPTMLAEYFTQVWAAARTGDKDALDRIEQLYNLVASKHTPGTLPMFNVNIGGQMAVASNGNGQGFDAFIRELNEARRQAAIPAPTQVIESSSGGE